MRTCLLVILSGGLFAAELSPTEYIGYVKYLASEDMRGRETGSPELEKAAAYIRDQFRSMNLKPLSGDRYYQDFEVTTSARLGAQNQVNYTLNRQKKALKFQQEFVPLNLSSAGKVSGEVVFAGYGITAPEYNYDDYAGLDAKDKIVVVLRHEPQEFDDKSVFEGKVYTAHSQIFAKAANAKMHGAKALLMVNDTAAHPDDGDKLEKFGTTAGPANGGIEFAQVKADVVEKWMELAGKSLAAIETSIDKDLRPQSFAFPASLALDVDIDIRREVKTVHNVGAYFPGETDEYVILGAHYDHLGLGEQFSLAPSLAGTIHPGADDNASGTAGVIELAHWFSHEPKHKRGILFLTFAGEELGLLGSSYYVNHPILPIEKAVAMINMDMIGRVRDRKIYVGGVGTGTTFAENARLKALFYAKHTGELTVAEDSGLEVDALDGAPGVESARFGGADSTYPEKFALLYDALRERKASGSAARFVCAVALASGGAVTFETRGVVEGEIAPEPRGTAGFGYDPIFFYPPLGCTLAEAGDRKAAVSHRGEAFRKLAAYLATAAGQAGQAG